MRTSTAAREEILGRIRDALSGASTAVELSHARIVRAYRRRGSLTSEALVALFIDRLMDYDAEVVERKDAIEIPEAVLEVLRRAGEQRLLIPAEFPDEWLPQGIETERDDDLSIDKVNLAQAVLTTCEAAVASTGTIFLVHGSTQGRRVATLLPDHHICLVRRNQIVELISEGLAVVASTGGRTLTTISGPSATSDIEMTRIRGVHGPRRLTVLLYGSAD